MRPAVSYLTAMCTEKPRGADIVGTGETEGELTYWLAETETQKMPVPRVDQNITWLCASSLFSPQNSTVRLGPQSHHVSDSPTINSRPPVTHSGSIRVSLDSGMGYTQHYGFSKLESVYGRIPESRVWEDPRYKVFWSYPVGLGHATFWT